jgi:hypothetical protein
MMRDTTMTTNNDIRPKLPPATKTNLHFPAINTFFSYFQKSFGKNDLSTLKGVQNKPNLNNSKNTIITALEVTYPKMDSWYVKKTNPIQTQTNPIQTQYKPKQSQFSSIYPTNHNQAFHLINQARFGYASIICDLLNIICGILIVFSVLFVICGTLNVICGTLNAICNILTGSRYED